MTITLYGTVRSRTPRCMWMLNELDLDYGMVEIVPRQPESQTPDYLAINPAGKVPTLVDDGRRIFESMAINLYLARKYKKLWPQSEEGQDDALMWSFWVMTEPEPFIVTMVRELRLKPEGEADQKKVAEAREQLVRPLTLFDKFIKGRDYILDEGFTVADLNVASTLALGNVVGVDYTAYPALYKWLKTCLSRPANQIEGSPFANLP